MTYTELALLLLVGLVAWLTTAWAVFTRRARVWLVLVLSVVGVVSAEVSAFMVYIVVLGATWEAPLVAAGCAAVSIASFVAIAKQPSVQ